MLVYGTLNGVLFFCLLLTLFTLINNLRFHEVVITPEDHRCLSSVVNSVLSELRKKHQDSLFSKSEPLTPNEQTLLQECEQLESWTSYVSQSLYQTWRDLPEGDHLKNSYRDQVWTWDDQDIAP